MSLLCLARCFQFGSEILITFNQRGRLPGYCVGFLPNQSHHTPNFSTQSIQLPNR